MILSNKKNKSTRKKNKNKKNKKKSVQAVISKVQKNKMGRIDLSNVFVVERRAILQKIVFSKKFNPNVSTAQVIIITNSVIQELALDAIKLVILLNNAKLLEWNAESAVRRVMYKRLVEQQFFQIIQESNPIMNIDKNFMGTI